MFITWYRRFIAALPFLDGDKRYTISIGKDLHFCLVEGQPMLERLTIRFFPLRKKL